LFSPPLSTRIDRVFFAEHNKILLYHRITQAERLKV
jgi:hypothetical protein